MSSETEINMGGIRQSFFWKTKHTGSKLEEISREEFMTKRDEVPSVNRP